MTITVNGINMEIGENLTEHAKKKIEEISEKYFKEPISANVTFEKIAHEKIESRIKIHPISNQEVFAREQTDDPYISFDMALKHIEIQLNKVHNKLKDHHG